MVADIRRMRDLREDSDLNQTQVAEMRLLVALCRFYNVSAYYLLGFINTPNPYRIKYK